MNVLLPLTTVVLSSNIISLVKWVLVIQLAWKWLVMGACSSHLALYRVVYMCVADLVGSILCLSPGRLTRGLHRRDEAPAAALKVLEYVNRLLRRPLLLRRWFSPFVPVCGCI